MYAPSFIPLPITGYSILNALGSSPEHMVRSLRAGTHGLSSPLVALSFETICGNAAQDLDRLTGSLAEYDCRQARLCFQLADNLQASIGKAILRWGKSRIGIVLATSTGGIATTENALQELWQGRSLPASYNIETQHNFYAHCDLLKKMTGIQGPAYVISTACSSSTKVFAAGQRMISSGLVDAVLVGGIDSLCLTTLYGFRCLGILSDTFCKPFSEERKGLNIGEGGALLLLEKEGEAHSFLLGVGESNDAHHMSSPHPEGLGALMAMREALAKANRSASQVDYVNAHGTGTKHNDASEAKAIETLFGEEVCVASTKGYTGHMLGAAGATEAVFSCIALEEGFIPRSVGADPVDSQININVSSSTQNREVKTVLSNSFGFGGSNASAVFGVVS